MAPVILRGERIVDKILMEFDYMYKNTVCATVYIFQKLKIVVKNKTDNILFKPFGAWSDQVNINDVYDLFESRCVPRTRFNIQQILDSMGLQEYDPNAIIHITHGVQVDDMFWIRFASERGHVTWEDLIEQFHLDFRKAR